MYPSTFYRVVAKALITNEEGKVLVVKENQDFWSLPGGGLEHGETPQQCLVREIKEEIGIDNPVIGDIVYSTSLYLDRAEYWMQWVVYRATIDSTDFVVGDGVKDAKFIDISEIEASEHILEKLIVETVKNVKK